MNAEDAVNAVSAGAYAIVVSNHGGRVMDNMPGAIDVLPEIAKAVKGKTIIIADGGVRTGKDVAKYLAFGADLVMIGRPIAIGAYGGDEQGVSFVLDKLRNDLYKIMLLTGTKDVKSFDKNNFVKYVY
jgi:isopentenyl diphosphate isomerase/L-lactate dehydrogenase-like FMN-dependent dehydrogenase